MATTVDKRVGTRGLSGFTATGAPRIGPAVPSKVHGRWCLFFSRAIIFKDAAATRPAGRSCSVVRKHLICSIDRRNELLKAVPFPLFMWASFFSQALFRTRYWCAFP